MIDKTISKIKIQSPHIKTIFEVIIIAFIVLGTMSGVFLWYIHQSPIDIGLAKETIETSLYNQESGAHAKMDNIYLHWPDVKGPLLLALDNVKVYDQNEQIIVAVDRAALGLSLPKLLMGKIKPSALIVHEISLNIRRTVEGIDIGYNLNGPATPVKKEQTDLSARILGYLNDDNHTHNSSPLSDLEKFSIQDALLNIDDRVLNVRWTVSNFDIDLFRDNTGLQSLFSATLRDPINDRVRINGHITQEKNSDTFLSGIVNVSASDISQSEIAALWPKQLEGEAAEEWLTEKLSKGKFTNLSLSAPVRVDKDMNIKTPGLQGHFSFQDMNIEYLKRLSPVQNATGKGYFDYDQDRLVIETKSGTLRGLEISNSSVKINHVVAKGKGTADVDINLKGPLSDVMAYIAEERIGAQHGFEINDIKGKTTLDVHLHFPTLKDVKAEDVQIVVKGNVTDSTIPDVVNDFDLQEGQYDVSLENGLIKIQGSATFNDRPTTLSYQQYIDSKGKPFRHKITAQTTGDTILAKKLDVDISEYVQGQFPIDLTYTKEDTEKTVIDIKADITESVLNFSPLHYKKPKTQTGHIKLQAHLKNNVLHEIKNLNVSTADANIENVQLVFDGKSLKSADIPVFKIKKNQGKAKIKRTKTSGLDIDVEASMFDALPFLKQDSKNQDSSTMNIKLSADSLLAANGHTLENAYFKALIDQTGRFNTLEFKARVGQGGINLWYMPDDNGVHSFTLDAGDAGAVLKAFDLYDKMNGGRMSIKSQPQTNTDIVNGTVEITDFSLVKAPILARLLGTLSLPGLLQTLNGDGVSFSKLGANYNWTYKPQGSVLTLKDGRTSGNAMGLTFDGKINLETQMVDISGTVIPLSDINNLINNIPLVGDILTGGSDSLFAATYTLKGSTDDPQVSVNPLSVLAPGILREVLFENNKED